MNEAIERIETDKYTDNQTNRQKDGQAGKYKKGSAI